MLKKSYVYFQKKINSLINNKPDPKEENNLYQNINSPTTYVNTDKWTYYTTGLDFVLSGGVSTTEHSIYTTPFLTELESLTKSITSVMLQKQCLPYAWEYIISNMLYVYNSKGLSISKLEKLSNKINGYTLPSWNSTLYTGTSYTMR